MKIVRVNWLDARSVDGWCNLNDFEENLSIIQTCGFLVKENDNALYISACAAIDDENSYACTIVIPKKMVEKMWELSGE